MNLLVQDIHMHVTYFEMSPTDKEMTLTTHLCLMLRLMNGTL